mmetsp:Transcript_33595/g.69377  ORF Transcript_33595/g.69377 Transcript_33595/m.69377 type:complete len:176 (-) Transcript_33595:214-741(-)
MEWIMLKRSFNPLKTSGSNPSTYWDALNNAVDQPIQLTQSCMRSWIKNITTARNNIIQLVPANAVDSVIKGKLLSVLKHTKHADPTITLNWFYKSNKWSDDYKQNPASITWKFLKSQILKEAANCARSLHDVSPPTNVATEGRSWRSWRWRRARQPICLQRWALSFTPRWCRWQR